MRRSVSLASYGVVALIAAALGCGDGPSMSVRVSDVSQPSALSLAAANAIVASDLQGMYFGSMRVQAADYRPGEPVQTGRAGNVNSERGDWSYWMASSGSQFDVVLKRGQRVALADFIAEGDRFPDAVTSEFADKAGTFEVDLLQVTMYRTGIIYADAYYGHNAELNGHDKHPLWRYPELAGLPDTYTNTQFAGLPEDVSMPYQTVSILYARSDWFSEPRVVGMWPDGGSNVPVIQYESAPLDEHQRTVLTSFAGDSGMNHADFYIVVPYALKTVDVARDESLKVDVQLDLSDALHVDTDVDARPPVVKFNADAHGVPFKAAVRFDAY